MSVFAVKDAKIGLNFAQQNLLRHLDLPVTTDFGLVDEKLQDYATEDETGPSRKKRKSSTLPSRDESFTLRFARRFGDSMDKSFLDVSAYGAALERFVEKNKTKNLRMYFYAKFDAGFIVSCKMTTKLGNKFSTENRNKKYRYFEGAAPFNATKMFRNDKHYGGTFSLEIMDEDAFDFGKFSETKPFIKGVLEEGTLTDFSIVANDGSCISCHKIFLAARSPVFSRILQMHSVESEENCLRVKTSEEGVKAFLKYIYYADLSDAFACPKIAAELLDLGHKYELKLLETAMRKLFMNKADEWMNIDASLALFLYTLRGSEAETLKEKALKLINFWSAEIVGTTEIVKDFLAQNANLDEVAEFYKQLPSLKKNPYFE